MTATTSNRISRLIINVLFTTIAVLMVLPLVLTVSISLTSEQALISYGYQFIPTEFSTVAYEVVFEDPAPLLRAYTVTIFATAVGTTGAVLLSTMLAYVVSRPDYRYRRIVTWIVFFTMLFGGGLVPYYILITQYLNLTNTIWALIIPLLTPPFMVLIMKGFLSSMIPLELIESAKLDGASEWRIFFRIIMPISKPAIATITILIAFMYWNDYIHGLLFIRDPHLVPLQLFLYRILDSIQFLQQNIDLLGIIDEYQEFPTLSVRMAMAILVMGPILFVFPFVQKHFVKGLLIGSFK